MTFQLDDYVDVPERIRLFNEKYPEGTLQGSGQFIRSDELVIGYLYQAKAYRSPDDPRPGVGTAFEKIPGATPYTRDSEVMNAETSAWGRAIVAVGIPSKRIASAEEVASRQPVGGVVDRNTPVGLPDEAVKVTKAQHAKIGVLVKEWMDVLERDPDTRGDPVGASRQFCVDRFGKHSRAELTKDEARQLIDYLEEMVVLAQVPFG